MSIEVTCPNGHALKIKEKYAGQKGRCPRCSAVVDVPAPVAVAEADLLALLGDAASARRLAADQLAMEQDATQAASSNSTSDDSGSSLLLSPKFAARRTKSCPSCRREVSMGYHLCPHCHTYFVSAAEVRRRQ